MAQYFEPGRELLKSADVLIGHVETPHTSRNLPSCVDIQAPPSRPEHLDILAEMGFTVCSVAGNHLYDCGPHGVTDTVERLRELGIAPVGGGADIDEARAPAIIERDGVTIGVLAFNAAGPRLGWAMSGKPGFNYIDVATHYHARMDMPGATPRTYTFVWPEELERLGREISALRSRADIVVVCLHKGDGRITPALADYERPLCHAAVDAGADVVLGHHHHLLKGVEVYKGKPIFHGLGNYVTVTYAMTAGYNNSPEMAQYLKLRAAEGRGDGRYPNPCYPWDKLSLNTMIARVTVARDGVREFGFIPALIDEKAVVHIKSRDSGGEAVMDFVRGQTDGARLGATLRWSADGKWIRFE
jgi:poly-gamma-glutamate synthesis protein (capsule biosynthesis protein)